MCVDFTDLNKACPKDYYPLPRIDQMVDATSGHQLLSFMDAYSGYNQVQVALEDQLKMAFAKPFEIFAFKIMSFGLTNAPVTFQRLIFTTFKDYLDYLLHDFINDLCVHTN